MRAKAHRGRGAIGRVRHRFDSRPVDWTPDEAAARDEQAPDTVVRPMPAKSIISHNDSPDIPFDRSINPFLGCEHGCVYCYARPAHAYLDLSPGLDFASRLFYKPNAVERLLAAWEKPGYTCEPITLGANTDPYQPIEKRLELTRALLAAFLEHRHPVTLISKGTLMRRDLDLLGALARERLVSVAISIPTLDDGLKRILEPRVPAARQRLALLAELRDAGVPCSVMLAPVIPAITDGEIEAILAAAAQHGATRGSYILLRLPHEVQTLFEDWLATHFPDRAAHVMSLLRQAHGGRAYDSRYVHRQRGSGAYADMLRQRVRRACRAAGLNAAGSRPPLDTTRFRPPGQQQLGLDFAP